MPSDDNDSLGEVVKKTEGSPRRKSTKKSHKSKKDVTTTTQEPLDINPVIRGDNVSSMNQRNILAGYGARGERIRHTVQDGALQMPREAWNLIKATTQETRVQASSQYSLPIIDSVLRPSVDPTITKLHVTRLEMEKVEVMQQPQVDPAMLAYLQQLGQPVPQPKVVKVLQPKATNSIIRRIPENKEAVPASTVAEPERIRGGGGEGTEIPGSFGGGGEEPPVQQLQTQNPPPAEAAPSVEVQPVAESQPAALQPLSESQPKPEENANQNPGAGAEATTASVEANPPVAATTEPSSDAAVAAAPETKVDTIAPETTTVPPPSTESASVAESEAAAAKPAEEPSPMDVDSPDKPPQTTTPEAPDQGEQNAESTKGGVAASTAETAQDGSTVTTEPPKQNSPASTEPAPPAVPLPGSENKEDPAAAPAASEETPKTEDVPVAPTPAVMETSFDTPQETNSSTEVQATSAATTEGKGTTQQATASTFEPAAAATNALAPSTATDPQASADKVVSTTQHRKGGKDLVKMEESNAQQQAKKEEKEPPAAQSLDSKPKPEWEQHKPGANDETVTPSDQLPERPEWYKKDSISDVERSILPEWFDSSSSHRTPETYMKARETAIKMSDTLANRNVTSSMMRRSIVGDAGSLMRLRDFLVHWGVINEDAINDSAPTPAGLRPNLKRPKEFSEDMRSDLILAVVQQTKRRKVDADPDGDHNMGVATSSSFIPINWDEVAETVGHGVSAEQCQKNFMVESLENDTSGSSVERPITPEATSEASKPTAVESKSSPDAAVDQTKEVSQKELIEKLVYESNPHVLGAVLDAAVKATDGNVAGSKPAALLGLQLSRLVEEARSHEVDLAEKLSQLVDMRMKKLENRMAMMDDVEAMLEAEKVALELERRDLYTARCRHWFGGA